MSESYRLSKEKKLNFIEESARIIREMSRDYSEEAVQQRLKMQLKMDREDYENYKIQNDSPDTDEMAGDYDIIEEVADYLRTAMTKLESRSMRVGIDQVYYRDSDVKKMVSGIYSILSKTE